MKNNMITMVLAISAACFGASALNAQSNDLTGKVPFGFQVSGKDFPAGRYIVRANGYSGIPSMQNADSGQSVFVSGATRSLTHAGPARLVFHCYAGNTCYLAEIRPATGSGSYVSMSKAEKEVASGEHAREMATVAVDIRRAD